MKVVLFSEEFSPDGKEADWPAIPAVGDVVSFDHRGGTSNLGVRQVRWLADTEGNFKEAHIHLTFDEVPRR